MSKLERIPYTNSFWSAIKNTACDVANKMWLVVGRHKRNI